MKGKPIIRAKDLSQIGFCEKYVVLKQKYGHRYTTSQLKRIDRGNKFHDDSYKAISRSQDKRCFIASSIYGIDADKTNKLRNFRDISLMPNAIGRLFGASF